VVAAGQGVFPTTQVYVAPLGLLPDGLSGAGLNARVELLVYTVLGLAATWGLYMLYMLVATRSAEGRPAAPLYPLFPKLEGARGKALVYCFSPQCGPCRPMSKEVDSLAGDGAPVFKLDITEHPEIARELGIRATPTLILIEDGAIARMLLGVKTADYMRGLLGAAAR
jgi:thiol-disulfide isomerase/thioredoxin